jgi:hypothetical protein
MLQRNRGTSTTGIDVPQRARTHILSVPLVSSRPPDLIQMSMSPDDGRVWEEGWLTRSITETQKVPVGTPHARPLQTQAAGPPLCQKYQTFQPQQRVLAVYSCVQYKAAKKRLSRRGKVVVGTCGGIAVLGVVLVSGGLLAPLVSAALPALVLPGASAIGLTAGITGTAATAGATTVAIGGVPSALGLSLVPSGDNISDYNRGKEIGRRDEFKLAIDWTDDGPPYEVIDGDPYPCP